MVTRTHLLVLALPALALAACASPRALDEPAARLAPHEARLVASEIEEARRDKEWTAAWNQAVDMGAAQHLFESIAIDALEDEDGASEAMFEHLREKWGALSPAARQRVQTGIQKEIDRGEWTRAAEIAILTADDAPAYAGAWSVYRHAKASPGDAAEILRVIREARDRSSTEAQPAGRSD